MTSRIFLDSNRDSAGDFIGECTVIQLCEPCMKTNLSNNASVFCKDCDEYLCDACKNSHTVHKTGQHEIFKFQDKKSALVMIDMKGMDKCHEHGRDIEFFCQEHAKLCCSSCVLVHRRCDQVEEITKVSRQTRPELQALKQSLIKLQSEADDIIADCKQSETVLNESTEKMSSEVDGMRDRIIQLFEDAKQKCITEATEFKTAESKRIGNRRDTSSKVKNEISNDLSMCGILLEHGTPSQQYIYSELMKEKRKTIESIMHDQRQIKVAPTVTVSFSKELTSFLEVGSNIIKLNYDGNKTVETSRSSLPSQPRQFTMELLLSVDLSKTGVYQVKPFLRGLNFLPDGRLVAIDNNNHQCIILNDRLQRLGAPYKFKIRPLGVVCVSHDVLCVTFGSSKVVCLLSVSTTNVIKLTREIKISSKVDSICCMSPNNMVVSTLYDPCHARMLSVDGVESNFDNLIFPNKTYTAHESVCTYVQSKNTLVLTDKLAHTVYMYDTVKGTSRAVTNENIRIPSGACVAPGDTVLVCSTYKNSIVHLSVNGEIIGTYPVDMRYPDSICVSKDGTKMAVSNCVEGIGKLQLYKLSPATS
ncbi:uncharacterized protein LOC127836519 [Dreissena polymorpha]|uniref:B box-type domain-containing protein n=1 Tax=Dreissena polymorpha TaxID=45954 RepID=A0A9D4G809_DREPO|nr:uncharacterized protein LOC127836519 [Dreissena polymorpha]KAH3810240.1 hypothetical protein DPMN_138630 [Dreissena polymorpha]